MKTTLVLVHTVIPLVERFDRAAADALPGARLLHILDEPLLADIERVGRTMPEHVARLAQHVQFAERSQADAVLVTCSTVSLCVEEVRPLARIPIFTIDHALIEAAVSDGPRVALVATNPTTVAPSTAQLERAAALHKTEISVQPVVVEAAFAALQRGDEATHDRLVADAVSSVTPSCDVVVLAQASMARALDAYPQLGDGTRVLASPQLALMEIRRYLERAGAPQADRGGGGQ